MSAWLGRWFSEAKSVFFTNKILPYFLVNLKCLGLIVEKTTRDTGFNLNYFNFPIWIIKLLIAMV